MSELDAMRYVVSQMIQAQDNHAAASAEFWALFRREMDIPAYKIPAHVCAHNTLMWYRLDWARKQYNGFFHGPVGYEPYIPPQVSPAMLYPRGK